MSRPNFIPRTRIGANGVRLFDIPGVYYPPEMLAQGDNGSAAKPDILASPKRGYISTSEAGKILKCASRSGVRLYLHKYNCPFCRVKTRGAPAIYWRSLSVRALARKKPPLVVSPSPGFISAQEACALVGCARSVLHRGVKKGYVESCKVRVFISSKRCYAVKSFYRKRDLLPFKVRCDFFRSVLHQACLQPPPLLSAP